MFNKELFNYISWQLKQGVSREKIKESLLAVGWDEKDIDETFNLMERPGASGFRRMSEVKSSQKPLFIFLSAIIGIVVLGGGIFSYFYYFQSPERIVQKMTEKMAEVQSLEYTGQLTAEVERTDFLQEPGKFLVDFGVASDFHDPNNPKALFKFDINTDAFPQTFEVVGEIVNDVVYVKLSNIPELEPFDFSFLEDQWIRFDPEEIGEQFGLKQIEEIQQEQELSLEQLEQIKEAAVNTEVFRVVRKLASQEIVGVNTRHYEFMIDKGKLVELFATIMEIMQDKTLTEAELQELNDSFEALEILGGEIWIGKKDSLLYRIVLDLNIKEMEETKSQGKISLDMQFRNYNKPVEPSVPTSAKPLEEIMNELFGELLLIGGAESF